MSKELNKYNKKIFEKIKEKFKVDNKALVIQPPASGKGRLALELINENLDKKIVYVTSTMVLLKDFKRKILKNKIEISEENLKIYTYKQLSKMNSNDLKPNILILDEIQKCENPNIKTSVKRILLNNKNAKILGITATPIVSTKEYFRNIAIEMFGQDNIVAEKTIKEAFEDGTLEKINYLEFKRDKKLPIFLSENLKKDGKYIIVCQNKKQLKKTLYNIKKEFGIVNFNINIYSLLDKKRDINETLKKYKNDNDKNSLKLLLVVNQINEGYHVKNADGIIIKKQINSLSEYIQLIGRIFRINKNNDKNNNQHPLVIDLAENYKKLEKRKKFLTEELIILKKFNFSENIQSEINNIENILGYIDFIDTDINNDSVVNKNIDTIRLFKARLELNIKIIQEDLKNITKICSEKGIDQKFLDDK